jgi:hypothetical protein
MDNVLLGERLGLPSPLMVAAKHKIVRRTKLCMSASSFAMASFPSPICLTATYGLIFATQLSKIATWCAKMQHEIDWDDLRTLISVARAGSLAGAAGALGSHRSTVLRRIERLEARLGLRLFDRTPLGLVLTAAGERVSPTAELMSDAVDEILRSVEADHGRPAGHIRLATTFNLAFGLLPCPIDRFRLAYPEIMVDVIEPWTVIAPFIPISSTSHCARSTGTRQVTNRWWVVAWASFNSPSTAPSHILPIGRYLNRQSVCASTSSCWVAVDSRISPHSGGSSNM